MELIRSISRFIPLLILSVWAVRIVHFTDHYFAKAYTDQLSILLVFLISYIVGIQVRDRLRLMHSTAGLLLFIFTISLLPITEILLTKTNYSTLPLYGGAIVSGAVVAGLGYQLRELLIALSIGIPASLILPIGDLLLASFVLVAVISSSSTGVAKATAVVLIGLSTVLTPRLGTKFESQDKYFDRVILADSTRFQNIDVTEWKKNRWYYSNGKIQFSSFDYYLYYEPFVHPVMHLTSSRKRILVIGNENGLLIRELLKYEEVVSIDMVPIDIEQVTLARTQPLFSELNRHSLDDQRVKIVEKGAFDFLYAKKNSYDLVFADSPDPVDIETNQYFTIEFYQLIREALHGDGLFVTQSLSPYLSPKSFQIVQGTVRDVFPSSTRLHNQVPTIGEWSWIIGSPTAAKTFNMDLNSLDSMEVPTQWLNKESLLLITSFGKDQADDQMFSPNTLINPSLYKIFNYEISHL